MLALAPDAASVAAGQTRRRARLARPTRVRRARRLGARAGQRRQALPGGGRPRRPPTRARARAGRSPASTSLGCCCCGRRATSRRPSRRRRSCRNGSSRVTTAPSRRPSAPPPARPARPIPRRAPKAPGAARAADLRGRRGARPLGCATSCVGACRCAVAADALLGRRRRAARRRTGAGTRWSRPRARLDRALRPRGLAGAPTRPARSAVPRGQRVAAIGGLPDGLRATLRESRLAGCERAGARDPVSASTTAGACSACGSSSRSACAVRRTWLHGERSSRPALIVQFTPAAGPRGRLRDRLRARRCARLLPGRGAAARVPATELARRAGDGDALPAGDAFAAALSSWCSALARDPWLERWPVMLAAAVPVCHDGRWWLRRRGRPARPAGGPRPVATRGARGRRAAAAQRGVGRPRPAPARGLHRRPAPRDPRMSTPAWEQLVASALLGTERRPPQRPSQPGDGALARALDGLAWDDAEGALLGAAGLLSGYRATGLKPPVLPDMPSPAPRDERPLCSPGAEAILERLLHGGPSALLAPWLHLARAAGVRPAPELHPALLDAALSDRALRGSVLHAGGDRLRWLAAHDSAGRGRPAAPARAQPSSSAGRRGPATSASHCCATCVRPTPATGASCSRRPGRRTRRRSARCCSRVWRRASPPATSRSSRPRSTTAQSSCAARPRRCSRACRPRRSRAGWRSACASSSAWAAACAATLRGHPRRARRRDAPRRHRGRRRDPWARTGRLAAGAARVVHAA